MMKIRRAVTLPEAMILILILALVAVAAGTGLQAVVKVPTANDKVLAVSNALASKMEEMHALGFANLPIGNTLSDTITLNGTSSPRSVIVSLYDADGNGTADADCKQITISLSGQSISAIMVQP
jgi:type II secretory pathway pseudopilin PulG